MKAGKTIIFSIFAVASVNSIWCSKINAADTQNDLKNFNGCTKVIKCVHEKTVAMDLEFDDGTFCKAGNTNTNGDMDSYVKANNFPTQSIQCVTKYTVPNNLQVDDETFCKSQLAKVDNNGGAPIVDDYCNNLYDLTVIVEESDFVPKDLWKRETKQFLTSVVKNVRLNKDKVHMSLVLFDRNARTIVPFSSDVSENKTLFLETIESLDAPNGNSDKLYAHALIYAYEEVIFAEGSRNDVPKVAILYYYGQDYGTSNSLLGSVLKDYKEKNIKLIVVGISLSNIDNAFKMSECTKSSDECPNLVLNTWDFVIPAANSAVAAICDSDDPSKFLEDSEENETEN
ncbi:von Willebrand factor A domain-related protein [Hepatocystis sp. ex Piliocolobus tephrosceles]|nr:von Willebrand factor A domain-related protein [Hepatocystis sp. ex Piliocolobus tephrosceles]